MRPAKVGSSEPDERGSERRAAGAFAYLTGQSLGIRAIYFLGQWALAKWLQPADFGSFVLAHSAYSFALFLQRAGLREILLSRQRRFELWARPATALALACGLAASALLLAAGPAAAALFGQPRLALLVSVLALACFLQALCVVPSARLEATFRFRALAGITLLEALVLTGSAVCMAAAGWGAASLVWPFPLAALVRIAALLHIYGASMRIRVRPRRWRYLVPNSATVVLTGLLYTVMNQGDYIVLGLFRSPHDVGMYYMAYTLGLQATILLGSQLSSALLPALAALGKDAGAQTRVYLRSVRLLLLSAVPLCLLQAALAQPIVRLLFGSRWADAGPLLEILSVAMAARMIALPVAGLLQAQGRFRTRLRLAGVSAACFVILVVPAAHLSGPLGVAAAVLAHSAIMAPISFYVGIRAGGGTWMDVGSAVAVPLLAGSLAVGVCRTVSGMSAPIEAWGWGHVALSISIAAITYVGLLRCLAPKAWLEGTRWLGARLSRRAEMAAP